MQITFGLLSNLKQSHKNFQGRDELFYVKVSAKSLISVGAIIETDIQ